MAWAKSREAAAAVLGVSGETLRKWQYVAWWKPEFYAKGKGYDVDAIKTANPRYADESGRADDVDQARQMSLLARKIDLQIRKSKLDERNRDLLPVDRLVEITTLHTKALVNSLTQLPIQLSKLVKDRKAKKALHDAGQNIVRKLLRTYAHDLEAGLQRLIDE